MNFTSGQEQAKKSYREILKIQIREGMTELKRPGVGLFVSALAAGLEVSFSVFLMATMLTRIEGMLNEFGVRLIVASLYSIGFIFVILGRSELFTEHTTLAVLPVLNGRARVEQLVRLWVLVWAGNIVGVVIFSFFTAQLGPAMGVISPNAFNTLAHELLDHVPMVMFWSAVAAGWLMGLLSWLVAASKDTMAQILLVWAVTFSIGFIGFSHSIVGSAEVLTAVFANGEILFSDYVRFIIITTLGNALGGGFFVAFLKYRHATRGRE